jgi:RNAse (barnase) inhibitor barstar
MIDSSEYNQYNPEISILRDGSINKYISLKVLESDIDWFTKKGYKIFKLNCEEWMSIADFHDQVSIMLEFPGYYGRNMDAFGDSIHSLEFEDYKGILIIFLHYDVFATRFHREAGIVLDEISLASRRYLIDGKRLIALVHTDDANFSLPSIGPYSIPLNSKESLSKINWEELM